MRIANGIAIGIGIGIAIGAEGENDGDTDSDTDTDADADYLAPFSPSRAEGGLYSPLDLPALARMALTKSVLLRV